MKHLRHLVACCLAFSLPQAAPAQDRPVVPFDGVEAFCHILHHHHLAGVNSVEDLARMDPAQTLVVVLGQRTGLDRVAKTVGGWTEYRRRGGALFLASDYPGELTNLNLAIGSIKIRQSRQLSYQGQYEECPLVEPLGQGNHPTLRDLQLPLATNRPAFLVVHDPQLERLAGFGEGSYFPGPLRFSAQRVPFLAGSAATAPPTDRLLIMAGHGFLTNGMLVQQDNDNFTLVTNAIRWLSEGPNGPRRHVLVLHQGQVIAKLDLPLAIPLPDGLPLAAINQLLRGIEEERLLQGILLEEVGKEGLIRGYWIVISVIFLVLAARRFMKAGARQESKIPLIVGLQEEAPPETPVQDQRLVAQGQGGNLVETAQVLARKWFLENMGIAPQDWDLGTPDLSRATIGGGFLERRRVQKMLRDLAEMTTPEPGTRVTPRQLGHMQRMMADLSTAASSGMVRFSKE